jgi:hypothetical protein
LHGLALTFGWQTIADWKMGRVSRTLVPIARPGLTILAGVLSLLQIRKARTFRGMLLAAGWIAIIYLTVGANWYWPWYASWPLTVAAFIGPGRFWNAAQILAISSMAIYAVFPPLPPPLHDLAEYTGLIVVVPPLGYLLWSYIRERRRGQSAPGHAQK